VRASPCWESNLSTPLNDVGNSNVLLVDAMAEKLVQQKQ
jgi:hypothetical protein